MKLYLPRIVNRKKIITIAVIAETFIMMALSAAPGSCKCGGGGSSGTIIDPPAGLPFVNPSILTNESSASGIFEATLNVARTQQTIGGKTAGLITYNASYPGPTIKVKPGDILRVHFKNNLPFTTARNYLGFEENHTNLHTHGMHVSPLPPADAAHLDIPAGGTYDYEYDLGHAYPGTLTFYHPHCHGLVAQQYWAGLIGTIITEDTVQALKAFKTNILVLKDFEFDANGMPTLHSSSMDYMMGKEGSMITVNGQVNPVVTMAPGEIQRWRILNASNARFYKLSMQGMQMFIIGTDGGLLDKPYGVTSLLLSPGERADFLIKATPASGSYKFLSLPYSRGGMMGGGMGGGGMGGGGCGMGTASAQITLLTVKISGTSMNQAVPAAIDRAAKRFALDTSMIPHRSLVLSMSMSRGYINGQDFDVSPFTIMSDLNTYEIWDVVNQSGMDHPFHQHTDAAQLMSVSGGDTSYPSLYTKIPAKKDVVIVPKMGSIRLLVPIMDWEGMAMFHCHILEHEDIGMMGMWHRMSDQMPMPMGN
jgi:FtsP/CotA-like multicopper oxidase with cupredoxin domain